MTLKQKIISALLTLIALLGGGTLVKSTLGGVDNFGVFTRATTMLIGKDLATRVATSSPARNYLEITNLSAATSTGQAIYCNTIPLETASTSTSLPPYIGFMINASSSKSFSRETGMPTSAIYCRNPLGTTSASVIEN